MGEFSSPFSEPLSFSFSYLSNIKIIFDFSDALFSVTLKKFTPHFKILDPCLHFRKCKDWLTKILVYRLVQNGSTEEVK